MENTGRKTRCWACQSLDVIRWGKQVGKQRFRCKNCGIFFTSENAGVKRNNELVWFRKWIIERQSLSLLSRDSNLSIRSLKRKFHSYLEDMPTWIIPKEKQVHLVLDGTYFKNNICLFVYLDNTLQDAILYRITTSEFADEILEDLKIIMSLGVIIVSITSDGHTSILSAIKEANKWIKLQNKIYTSDIPPIINQRCLVHIQRYCLTLLKKDSKSVVGKKLRAIIQTICKIDTWEKCELFLNAFNSWYVNNEKYIMQMSYGDNGRRWRTHKELYSAYIHIKRALKSMFHHLNDSNIPYTTNAIEGYFSHMKNDIKFHRGLSKEHKKSFLRWYIYFKNK